MDGLVPQNIIPLMDENATVTMAAENGREMELFSLKMPEPNHK